MKNVSFSIDGSVHQQRGNVVMSSPLGPVLVRIFMVALEESIVPKVKYHFYFWKGA